MSTFEYVITLQNVSTCFTETNNLFTLIYTEYIRTYFIQTVNDYPGQLNALYTIV